MNKNLGYNKKIFILPFDHRSSFAKMLGFDINNLDEEKIKIIIDSKQIIYEAFKKSISNGIPKEEAAILVDEEFGDKILLDASSDNYTTILTTEKSGKETFEFEYGENFKEHIEKYKPTFAKALIRYKENADWNNLKILSDYCHETEHKFLLEVLSGIDKVSANDLIPIIDDLRGKGIEPDVWKLEGMENKSDYQSVIVKIKEGERQNVGLVVLGRGASREKVEEWIKIGKGIDGIIGFAVGRTIFWDPLIQYSNKKIDRDSAIASICNNFMHFYNIFLGKES